jgi:glutathione S-transferase
MLTLYHFGGAICAQKVRLALAEKGLEWESRSVLAELRSPEYLKLNPNGYVPTLVHDGRVLTESRIINEYLENAFPEPPLLPNDPFQRARVALWTKQIDDSLHLNVYVLTFAINFRQRVIGLSEEQRVRSLPLTNPVKRDYTLDLIERGFNSRYFGLAVARFMTLLREMETALATSTWLVGDTYSLADVDFTPYLRRLEDLGLWSLVKDQHPNVARWYGSVKSRPSYQAAILDWVEPEIESRERRNADAASPYLAEALNAA